MSAQKRKCRQHTSFYLTPLQWGDEKSSPVIVGFLNSVAALALGILFST
jgi:hypothetical protein